MEFTFSVKIIAMVSGLVKTSPLSFRMLFNGTE
jgi:hypothetical protein